MPPAARGSFKKPPLDPVKLFIIKFFWLKPTTLTLCGRPYLLKKTKYFDVHPKTGG
jgi:hypothetical protein